MVQRDERAGNRLKRTSEAMFLIGVLATVAGVGFYDWRAGVVLFGVVSAAIGFLAMMRLE